MLIKCKLLIILGSILFLSCQDGNTNASAETEKVVISRDTEKTKTDLRKHKLDIYNEVLNTLFHYTSKTEVINSDSNMKMVHTMDKEYIFPFDWDFEMSNQCLNIAKIVEPNYIVFILGYAHPSTSSNNYETYLFTYSRDGIFLDMQQINNFFSGSTDAMAYLQSSFYKNFGNSGLSQIRFSNDTIFSKNAALKIFNNKTEEINEMKMTLKINTDGSINIVDSSSNVFYYFKNNKLTDEGNHYNFY